MRYRLNILQLNRFLRQQPERPSHLTGRGFATTQCHYVRLHITIDHLVVDTVALPSIQGRLKSLFHKPLFDPINFAYANL
jgi:hypothetical protein